MFNKLSFRFIGFSFVSLFLVSCVITLTAHAWTKQSILQQYKLTIDNYLKGATDNLDQYLQYNEDTIRLIEENPRVFSAMKTNSYDSGLNNILDNLTSNLNPDMLGLSIYLTNGLTYTVNRAGNVPTFQKLQEESDMNLFFQSNGPRGWLYRSQSFPYYGIPRLGVYTFIEEVIDTNGTKLGYIFADWDLAKLFRFFNTRSTLLQGSSLYFIDPKGDIVDIYNGSTKQSFPESELHQFTINSNYFQLYKENWIVAVKPFPEVGKRTNMLLLIPTLNAFYTYNKVNIVLWTALILFGASTLFFTLRLNRQIVSRLEALYFNMKKMI